MSRSFRFSSAISLIALSTMIASCATPQKSGIREVRPAGEVGLATRALAALNADNVPLAIDLAERAVEKSPNDAGFRGLLGNAYFAGGRFASAEAAYRDSLTLYSNQPQVVLKLALVQIALGKKAEAADFLGAAQNVINPTDYGLALALAGREAEAISVLQSAARQPSADARVRQNLALAYALSGDWTEARTIAAQDVPANQLDARIQQWMQLASPKKPSDQVASLIGVTPAAVDQGQPVRLALRKPDTQMAQVAPIPARAPQPEVATVAPASQPQVAEAVPAPAPQFADVVAVPPAPPPPRAPVAAEASPAPVMALLAAASKVQSAVEAFLPHKAAAKPVKPRRVAAAAQRPAVRNGKSPAVVQIGAYSSANRVTVAWNGAARKYGALKAYMPMSARFAGPKGVFYRLSVKGFASTGEAKALCAQLRRAGGKCFVRNFAGDAPVQYALR
jgi:Flp pilus assembly protein TadD